MLWLISFVNNYKSLVSNSATDLSFLSYGALPLGLAIAFVFKTEEMVADRSFYYFIFFIPIILLDLISVMPVSTFVRYIAVIIGINAWFIKTLYLQYPGWFIPPFQSIRM
jgi:hypothetical protein